MSRALPRILLVALFGLTAARAGLSLADDDGKCKLATKGDSPVVKACTDGGIKKAKATMKDMVKQGKAAGVKMECDDCHKDEKQYDVLTDDAKDKFKKLLAALAKK
jgi:hypothetical protein